jgi:tRNA(fMet)-specific endonuclease VapC
MGLKFLLDTNIISEPTKNHPNENVMQHLAKHNGEYCTSSIVWHEMVYGCELLVESKRKIALQSYLTMLIRNGLIILPYDQMAADFYAKERARLQSIGKTCAYADGEIASIAVSQNLILVTRNTDDFINFQDLSLQNWFISDN